ncbi:hypothetical protein ACQ4PT_030877 [Festuca glaucescens]
MGAAARRAPEQEQSCKATEDFDTAKPPPFRIGDVRAAVPAHCWRKSPLRSLSYVARDLAAVAALALLAWGLDSWVVWPLYWAAQGTLFWALFVLGHDWRISHRTHHQNHGHIDKDESWHPITENVYKELEPSTKKLRFSLPYPLLAFPVYLWYRSPGKNGSHFNPSSDLFSPKERRDVIISTTCWITMIALLIAMACVFGPVPVLKLYGVPYVEWSYLRGGLTTVDRDYGWINNIHHDIGTHVIHHLFPQIPHYHLVEATKAARPVLGRYYREPEKSGPLPTHLISILLRSLRVDHFVSDVGDVVFYQTDPSLSGDNWTKNGKHM